MSPLHIFERLAYCDMTPVAPTLVEVGVLHGFLGKQITEKDRHLIETTLRPKQHHGIEIVSADFREIAANGKSTKLADGIFSNSTTTTSSPVGVVTADCLPVLLASADGKMVSALHAGWRGLAAGIIQKAIHMFAQQNQPAKSLKIAFGPCISPAVYEVGPEVIAAFTNSAVGPSLDGNELSAVVTKGSKDRWFLDLGGAAVLIAAKCGIPPTAMSLVRTCTYSFPDQWFSYRRTKNYEGNNLAYIFRSN